jgi:hypothetical protein
MMPGVGGINHKERKEKRSSPQRREFSDKSSFIPVWQGEIKGDLKSTKNCRASAEKFFVNFAFYAVKQICSCLKVREPQPGASASSSAC